jgi:hypothetical protein
MLKTLPFIIINEQLYKQGQYQILHKCLHDDKILVILHEMHEGVGGGHHNSKGVRCQVLMANST